MGKQFPMKKFSQHNCLLPTCSRHPQWDKLEAAFPQKKCLSLERTFGNGFSAEDPSVTAPLFAPAEAA